MVIFSGRCLHTRSHKYKSSIKTVINCKNLLMTGQGMLVRTVLEESATGVDMYFPGNASALWYDAADYKQFIGGSKVCKYLDPCLRIYLNTAGLFVHCFNKWRTFLIFISWFDISMGW